MILRISRSLAVAAAALAVAATAGCSSDSGRATDSTAPAGRAVTGTFTISAPAGSTDPCAALPDHPDLVDGAAVQVNDSTGNLLTTGSLGKGTAAGATCVRQLQLPALPPLDSYRISIGSYGPIEVTADALTASGGVLDLRLGA
ncbi:MAG: hypothetical protein ACOYMR_07340 [Ilumatobacteraceae bacterium]